MRASSLAEPAAGIGEHACRGAARRPAPVPLASRAPGGRRGDARVPARARRARRRPLNRLRVPPAPAGHTSSRWVGPASVEGPYGKTAPPAIPQRRRGHAAVRLVRSDSWKHMTLVIRLCSRSACGFRGRRLRIHPLSATRSVSWSSPTSSVCSRHVRGLRPAGTVEALIHRVPGLAPVLDH